MASIWKGAVSFGLVNVQVKIHPATQDNDVSFRQVHNEDGGRIRYKRFCEICGTQVEYRDIAKAYEASNGQVVTISDAELQTLPAGRSREIEVIEFVPAEDVDPILFDRSYYLEPDPGAVRPYILLREAIKRTDKTAIAHVALRTKTRLAALRVYKDVIVLQTMLWEDEVREPAFAVLREADIEIRDQELKMAASLIETLESEFDPEQYSDEYRKELLILLEKKLESGEDVVSYPDDGQAGEPVAVSGNVVDLMAALQASIDRGQETKSASKPVKKAAKKPAAAGKVAKKEADDSGGKSDSKARKGA